MKKSNLIYRNNPDIKPATKINTEAKPAKQLINVRSRNKRLKRNYNAATLSNLTSSWTTTSMTADQVIYQTLKTVRARAREQVANNDYAKRFIGMAKTHVVGSEGFGFQAKTVGRDGKQDVLANTTLEQHWREWQKPKYCDAAQQLSFNSLLRLWIGTLASDGEIIIRVRKGSDFGRYGFGLQLIDPELLDPLYCDDTKNRHIRHGIEFDDLGRPVAYYFKKNAAQSWAAGYNQSSNYTRVPANEIYHDFIVERVGQKRGIPWLATPLTRMQMLEGYENAAITNARVGASKMAFYEQGEDADPNAFSSLQDEGGELVQDATPGEFGIMPYGWKLHNFDPAYPNGEFDSFTKAALRGIAAGLGVSYFKLANDLEGVNYSSGRLGEMEDREIWKALQNWMIEGFLSRLYDDWLEWQLATGTLTFNTKNGQQVLSERFIDKYKTVRFQGRRWQWTDPLKEANGNKVNLEQRLTSPQKIIRENGDDPDEVINEWKQWQEKLTAAGITTPENVGVDNEPNEETE